MKKKTYSGLKIICLNRKASFNYFFDDIYEAGIMLKGSEIKSVREGKVNIADSYAVEKKGEIVEDLKSFKNKISKVLRNGDFLMIKGSNATKLHEVSRKFIGVGN